jgi:hypothetical protein
MVYTKQEEGSPSLIEFSDANLGSDVDTWRSTSDIVFFLGGNSTSWQSTK